ncbi:hypothetical protein HanRHA438_Chr05g0233561 [Helianthus annuus]|nr:hypothetical protein HanRHA438_Chr05g0233561 [Helianthus annuus]
MFFFHSICGHCRSNTQKSHKTLKHTEINYRPGNLPSSGVFFSLHEPTTGGQCRHKNLPTTVVFLTATAHYRLHRDL